MSDSLRAHGLYPSRLLCPWDSPGKNIPEWVAILFSRGSSQPRDWTRISLIEGGFLTIWAEPPGKPNVLISSPKWNHWVQDHGPYKHGYILPTCFPERLSPFSAKTPRILNFSSKRWGRYWHKGKFYTGASSVLLGFSWSVKGWSLRRVQLFVCVFVTRSCLTPCDSMDCSPPDFSVHGILQATAREWVVTPFSRGSSQPRD